MLFNVIKVTILFHLFIKLKYNLSQEVTTKDNDVNPTIKLILGDYTPPSINCSTFVCITDTFKNGNKGEFYNITEMLNQTFGGEAGYRYSKIFKRINISYPILKDLKIETEPSAFKLSGNLPYFLPNATYEGIFRAEKHGYISLHMGILIPRNNQTNELVNTNNNNNNNNNNLAIIPNANTMDNKEIKKRKLFIRDTVIPGLIKYTGAEVIPSRPFAGVGLLTFYRLIGMTLGLQNLPNLPTFFLETGDLGIIVSQRVLLIKTIQEDTRNIVDLAPTTKFHLSGLLQDFPLIQNRLLFVGGIKLSETCIDTNNNNTKNLFCLFLRKSLNKTNTILQITYDPGFMVANWLNALSIKRITIGLGNIPLHFQTNSILDKDKETIHKLELIECGFYQKFGGLSGITSGFTSKLLYRPTGKLEDRSIIFKVEIGFEIPSLNYEADIAMIGLWENVFNIPFLHIGNIHGVISLSALEIILPSGITLGFEAWIGPISSYLNGNQTNDTNPNITTNPNNTLQPVKTIKIAGFTRLFSWDPTNWYMYGYLSNITLQQIVQVMWDAKYYNITINKPDCPILPPLIGSTGVEGVDGEDGIFFSFSPFVETTLNDVEPPRTIRAGITMKGKILIYGYWAVLNFNIDWYGFKANAYATFKPLNLVNHNNYPLLQLFRDKNTKEEGPFFKTSLNFSSNNILTRSNAIFSGYINILGMGNGFIGEGYENRIEIKVNLLLFNFFELESKVIYYHDTKSATLSSVFILSKHLQIKKSFYSFRTKIKSIFSKVYDKVFNKENNKTNTTASITTTRTTTTNKRKLLITSTTDEVIQDSVTIITHNRTIWYEFFNGNTNNNDQYEEKISVTYNYPYNIDINEIKFNLTVSPEELTNVTIYCNISYEYLINNTNIKKYIIETETMNLSSPKDFIYFIIRIIYNDYVKIYKTDIH